MEHFQYPCNRGAMESPDVIGHGSLHGSAPFVTLYLKLDEERVSQVTFEAAGCGVTIACASAITELVLGRKPAQCLQISRGELAAALDGVPEDKSYCADVVIDALRDAVRRL
jgi:nitrogen fixation NifU-like protein